MFYERYLKTVFVEMLIGKCHVICGTIYCLPNQHSTNNELFLEKLNHLLNLLNKEKNKITNKILGDFNYDLFNPNKYAELYAHSLYTMIYFPLINKPTRISSNVCSLIDNIWTYNVKFRTESVILAELVSDYFAVMQCTFFPSTQSTQEPNSHSRLLNQNTIKLFNERLLAGDWFEILALQDPN